MTVDPAAPSLGLARAMAVESPCGHPKRIDAGCEFVARGRNPLR
jgi:hypothetical protein